MFEVIRKEREVNGIKLETCKTKIISSNIFEVEVGTTGYMGGDTGHGGRTYFSLRDIACSDIKAKSLNDTGFEVELSGDAELTTLIESLEFAIGVLKEQVDR